MSRRSPVIRASLLLAALAFVVLFAGGSSSVHVHADGIPAFYNPDCQILALAILAGSVVLAAGPVTLVVTLRASSAALLPGIVIANVPRAQRRPRAPPALSV